MMTRSPCKYKIHLSGQEKHDLRQAKKKGRRQARLVSRILIILLADAGKTIAETAELLGCCEQTVLNQRKRFVQLSRFALNDLLPLVRPRTGLSQLSQATLSRTLAQQVAAAGDCVLLDFICAW